jgi:hypothetical protein
VRWAIARTLQERRAYLDLLEKHRGINARRAFEQEILSAWRESPAPRG